MAACEVCPVGIAAKPATKRVDFRGSYSAGPATFYCCADCSAVAVNATVTDIEEDHHG